MWMWFQNGLSVIIAKEISLLGAWRYMYSNESLVNN